MLLTFIQLFGFISFGQTFDFEIGTQWDAASSQCFPCDYNEATAEVISSKTVKIPVRGHYKLTTNIKHISYVNVELPTKYDKNLLPSEPSVQLSIGRSRGEAFLIAKYNPLVNQNGEIKLVEKVSIEVVAVGDNSQFDRSATFASESVLSSGTWYKIGVDRSGVFKIDQSFLSSLGVNTSSLSPNSINIYGNHIPKLPTLNSDYHPDDLLKNSIFIQGDGDGSFDASDYILFYATGPDEVKINYTNIQLSKNKIDSLAYYYIHIDASDVPKRIGTVTNSTLPVTHNVTKSNDAVLHELNETNLLKSGDGWYGENFDIELTKSFTMSLDQLSVSDSILMETQYVSDMKSGSSNLSVNVNGVNRDIINASTVTGSYTVATVMNSEVNFLSNTGTLNMLLTYTRSSPASQAWLDYIQLNYKRKLNMGSNQFLIRSLSTVGAGNVSKYSITGASNSLIVWEITDPTSTQKVNGSLTGSTYSFAHNSDTLRTYAVFVPSQAYTPIAIKSVPNQNLHGLPQADYLIISHSSLLAQADRLANLHRDKGMIVHVIDIQKVYNEFSCGAADPVAVRWFAKMFYDRAGGDPTKMPQYLCLFGDGTYDPLNRLDGNNYLLPTYNSVESGPVDFIASFTADDFFGLLDDGEAISSSDLLDIGIGRIPVSDLESAKDVVNKIEHYMNYGSSLYGNATGVVCDAGTGYASTFGDWRTRMVLMADDEEGGTFVKDCEVIQWKINTRK